MNITLNPEVPAITAVVIPAKPATVTMTVTVKQFAQLRALVGQLYCGIANDLFISMDKFMGEQQIPYVWVEDNNAPAIKFKTN